MLSRSRYCLSSSRSGRRGGLLLGVGRGDAGRGPARPEPSSTIRGGSPVARTLGPRGGACYTDLRTSEPLTGRGRPGVPDGVAAFLAWGTPLPLPRHDLSLSPSPGVLPRSALCSQVPVSLEKQLFARILSPSPVPVQRPCGRPCLCGPHPPTGGPPAGPQGDRPVPSMGLRSGHRMNQELTPVLLAPPEGSPWVPPAQAFCGWQVGESRWRPQAFGAQPLRDPGPHPHSLPGQETPTGVRGSALTVFRI